jgi:endonuclease/exonuclease/phosphatase family metal-dependent hydrolase
LAVIRFATYNLLDLFATDSRDERDRYARVVEVIRSLDVEVLAVQEIVAADVDTAGAGLMRLADDCGLSCFYEPGRPAIGAGRQRFHVGLLWKPELTVVPGSFRAYGAADFWHALVKITFDVGGRAITHASHHATPFGRRMRADQMERVVAVMTRPEGRPPALIGADWNCVAADRTATGSYYDPDPYADGDWYEDLIYQARWWYDADGRRHHHADREAGEVLYAGGLADAAAALDAPWQPTSGLWTPPGPYGPRRVDAIRVTSELVPALRAIHVNSSPLAIRTSDHLPVGVSYDPADLGPERWRGNPRIPHVTPTTA